MTMAVVTSGTGSRMTCAEATMRSVDALGNLPVDVERLVLCDPGGPTVDFAVPVPVTIDYSDLTQDAVEREEFKKFFMFLLPYERVIYLDPGLTCSGRIASLAGRALGRHLLYVNHLSGGGFDDGTIVFNHDRLLGFHDLLLYLTRNRFFSTCGDTSLAVLNGYFGYTKQPTGDLPACPLQRVT